MSATATTLAPPGATAAPPTLADWVTYPLVLALPLVVHGLIVPHVPTLLAPSLALVPFWVVVATLEVVRPYHAPWAVRPGQKHILRDFLTTLVVLPTIMKVTDIAMRPLAFGASLWPHHAPLAVQVVLVVILGELAFYWMHRAAHHTDLLWRFHRVHHSITEVHWLNSGYFSVVDGFVNFAAYFLPLRLLGVPDEVFGWFVVLTGSTGTLEHADLRYRTGPLKLIFDTGELHRLHHSVKHEISCSNFGKISCLWDLVFGTFRTSEDPAVILDVGPGEEEGAAATALPAGTSGAPRAG